MLRAVLLMTISDFTLISSPLFLCSFPWTLLPRQTNDPVTNICHAADKQLFTLVEWAKRIPHFSDLTLEDQVILLRAGNVPEAWPLGLFLLSPTFLWTLRVHEEWETLSSQGQQGQDGCSAKTRWSTGNLMVEPVGRDQLPTPCGTDALLAPALLCPTHLSVPPLPGWNELLIASFSHRSVSVQDGILLATGLHVHRSSAHSAGVGSIFDRYVASLSPPAALCLPSEREACSSSES